MTTKIIKVSSKDLQRLQRKSWHLWALTLLLLVIFAICIAIVVVPARWEKIFGQIAPHTLTVLLFGLLGLTLMFCTYVISSERMVHRLSNVILLEEQKRTGELEMRADMLEQFCHSTVWVSSISDKASAFNNISRIIKDIFKADYVSLMLRENSHVGTEGMFGAEQVQIRQALVKIGQQIAGWVLQNDQPLLLTRNTDFSRFHGYFQKEMPIASAICVPLKNKEQIIGVINVTRLEGQKDFTQEDMMLLNLFANHISVCADNIRLMNQLTDEQKKAAEAERLAALGRVISGLAHEINNSLNIVNGFTYIALHSDEMAEIKEVLTKSYKELDSLSAFVKDALLFGRSRSLKKSPANINEMIQSTLQVFNNAIKTNNIEVISQMHPEDIGVAVDANQIARVLSNIVKNGIEAMESSPTRKLTIDTTVDGNWFRVSISDSGNGIPQEHLERIFDPFFTTKDVGRGTGLGLSIARKVIDDHRGKISACNNPAGGASFTIELPIKAESAECQRSPVSPQGIGEVNQK